jgi:hypothetical protein
MSMLVSRVIRSATPAALATAVGTLFLTGCALIQPPPVPQMPRLRFWGTAPGANCTADIGRAHGALAAAGAAAGDPAAIASAHAAAAVAMSEYHACLSQPARR